VEKYATTVMFGNYTQCVNTLSSTKSVLSGIDTKLLLFLLFVRSQAKDSRKAKVEQGEFDEELSEQEGRLPL
jgi:hypothetical protein